MMMSAMIENECCWFENDASTRALFRSLSGHGLGLEKELVAEGESARNEIHEKSWRMRLKALGSGNWGCRSAPAKVNRVLKACRGPVMLRKGAKKKKEEEIDNKIQWLRVNYEFESEQSPRTIRFR